MKTSSYLLWGVVAVLAALAIGVSCADSAASCDLADCTSQCQAAGHAGGECRSGGECYCTETPPADADADVPDVVREDAPPVDVPDVRPDTPPDTPIDTPPTDDSTVRDETTVRDEATVREDAVREDTSTSEGGEGGSEGSSDGGEAKSGCDPLLCFMSCGGTCSVGGECVCEATPAP